MQEPVWILEDVVRAIHTRQIAEHAGTPGVRDAGLLDSALARPRNAFAYRSSVDLADLAAAYAFGIARNHPFLDGNKRTALVCCELFVRLNGFAVKASQDEKFETFIELAAGRLEEEPLAQWLRAHLVAQS